MAGYKIMIQAWKCLRCGHKWPRKKGKKPRVCANKKCHSPYWNKPREARK